MPIQRQWCQPAYVTKRMWMVVYVDPDMGIVRFEDEAEARAHFAAAEVAWNCYLFGAAPMNECPGENP